MKEYEVFDQRFPEKHSRGWNANLIPCGKVQAEDSDRAFALARKIARFPVLHNHDDFVKARDEEVRLPAE